MTRVACFALAACALGPASGFAQSQPSSPNEPADVAIQGYVYEVKKVEPTEERIKSLKAPDGFKIEVFARDLINPRMIAVSADGTVYVTRRGVGDVVMLKDADGDGRAELRQVVATRPQMHGIAIAGDVMYLATTGRDVYRTLIRRDGTLGELQRIIDDLAEGGQHPNKTLAIGPDNYLYISSPSTCNACDETNAENATILRAKPDGTSRTIYASGLRNTIGFAWHPETKALYGMDMGIDWLGNDAQREELNRIEQGKSYGWPYIYEEGKFNPQDEPPGGISLETWAKISTPPALTYTAHSSPLQLAFAAGSRFPAEYQGDAFVTMRGSWNRKPPSGYEVVRIRFENGEPRSIEPFLTGFLIEENGRAAHFGRPTGLAFTRDGAMLVGDDTNGVIYKVSYQDASSSATGGVAVPGTPPNADDRRILQGDRQSGGPESLEREAIRDRSREENRAQGGQPATENLPSVEDRRILQGDRQSGGPESVAGEATRDQVRETNRAQNPETLVIALETPQFKSGKDLQVTSSAFRSNTTLAPRFSADGQNISPPLAWDAAPEGTKSFAILMEDPDATEPKPFIHWIAYNIPAETSRLSEGVSTLPKLAIPEGTLQGRNSRGSLGYYGPTPPKGDPAHDYHFQIFALDAMLPLDPGASREDLLKAMNGRVLARGQIVGRYRAPE